VAHGGKIWAENLSEGGACFNFTIPLENEKDQHLEGTNFSYYSFFK
jgi:K+-sensing histidine kinase KdpD